MPWFTDRSWPTDEPEPDPYDREENYLRTDGRDVCHWCALRPQEVVWSPYETRVCGVCDDLATQGLLWEIAEEQVSRLVVRGWLGPHASGMLADRDPDRWRDRELDRLTRWVEVRVDPQPVEPHD